MENKLCHEHAVIEVLAAAAGFGEAEKAIAPGRVRPEPQARGGLACRSRR
jgi:hypothetical protein